MKTDDFYYDLPEAFIAQTPVEPRHNSRLCVVPKDGGALQHRNFWVHLNPSAVQDHHAGLEIVGDLLKVEAPESSGANEPAGRFGDLAVVQDENGATSLAQIIRVDGSTVLMMTYTSSAGRLRMATSVVGI